MTGYDPLPDLAMMAMSVYDGNGDHWPARGVAATLRDGLGVDQNDMEDWLDALRRALGNGMPGTPAGDEPIRRTEEIAAMEQLLRRATDGNISLAAQAHNAAMEARDLAAQCEGLRHQLEACNAARERVLRVRLELEELRAENARLKADEGDNLKLAQKVQELFTENEHLKTALQLAGSHAVHIVPEGLALADAIAHVHDGARPGDVLRFATGCEVYLSAAGTWLPVTTSSGGVI
jgi:hypothetical protein